jgi:DNA repair protein RadC
MYQYFGYRWSKLCQGGVEYFGNGAQKHSLKFTNYCVWILIKKYPNMKTPDLFSQIEIAEVQLIYKSKVPASQRRKITCSKDAYDLLLQSWDTDTIQHCEEFKILLMNRSNAVLGILAVSKGGISGTVTDVRIIFQAALKSNASGLIVCHNHPSGNLNPSESDTKITHKIKEAGNLLDIQLLDHIIINEEDYYSFADNGLL